MKKLLLCIAAATAFASASAQTADTSKFKPYIGAGAGISANTGTCSLEAGYWNDRTWYAVVAEYTPKQAKNGDSAALYLGPKFYKRVDHFGKIVDMFVYGAVKFGVSSEPKNNDLPMCFEPGACLVFNVTSHIGLQWSFSAPVYEKTNLFSPVVLSTSACFNWFF
jgi:hypothetical protein